MIVKHQFYTLHFFSRLIQNLPNFIWNLFLLDLHRFYFLTCRPWTLFVTISSCIWPTPPFSLSWLLYQPRHSMMSTGTTILIRYTAVKYVEENDNTLSLSSHYTSLLYLTMFTTPTLPSTILAYPSFNYTSLLYLTMFRTPTLPSTILAYSI